MIQSLSFKIIHDVTEIKPIAIWPNIIAVYTCTGRLSHCNKIAVTYEMVIWYQSVSYTVF